MNVLARLALRAIGAPSTVRPRLGGLFEGGQVGALAQGGADLPATLVVPTLTVPQAAIGAGQPTEQPFLPMAMQMAPPARFAEATTAAIPAPPNQRFESPGPAELTTADEAPAPPPRQRFASQPEPGTAIPLSGVEPISTRLPSGAPEPYRPLLPPTPAARLSAAPTEPRLGQVARQEPDLQISIGRIEVRGEAERRRPAPTPRQAPKLMSLEDYLAKGRRR